MSFDSRYRMLSGSIIPRPIAFVTTINENGAVNAAPFSSFMIASVEAGCLAFSVGPSSGAPKGTLRNIRRDNEFVINMVSEELAREVQLCGADHGPGVSKLELAGLEVIDSERIKVPRVARSKIQFECKLHSILLFGESHMVIGEIILMHARKGVVENGKIDPARYAPLGRIGGRTYCNIRETFSV